ncbi:conserved phage C-terminal domain-containing protein [Tissierella praeacuta]|uniref:conserved phage C-terminal domain-containing protein n=1 Tax=Tissierella praeacuta TaxID=43131 RepID=UPI003DA695F2
MSGWISIHRKIKDNWIWEDKPFSKGQAWIDILLMVNHEYKKIPLGNELVEVKRGSRVTSIRQLCDRWGWSNTKVRGFLKLLEEEKMLIVKSDSKKTTLTVVNYNDYQVAKDSENDTETTEKHHRNIAEKSQKHTNNNDNNDNNDNKDIYADIVEYLNSKTNKNFKHTSKATQRHISARLNEKYTLDDFKKVIDIKTSHWLGDPKMETYLRPETLFGTKFESYLNENVKTTNKSVAKKTRFHMKEQRTDNYSNEELESVMERKRREARERMKGENGN